MSKPHQSTPVISVRGLAKTYQVYHSPGARLAALLGLPSSPKEVKALKPLSFELFPGETVGIVGANGSGKSTLLQMLCGTLTPSEGDVVRRGRIAALLELGAGFSPEFTGRENVYLNASINGMSREQTDSVLEQILAFADIGAYIDQPVKTYSSGMYVRLAFAVAINVQPDVLIIDEALAVGDEAFQRKCFARLRDLQAQGVSILFVSHSAESVMSLCDRALLIDSGELLMDCLPKAVIASYQKLLYAREEQREAVRAEIRENRFADSTAKNSPPLHVDGIQCHPELYHEDMVAETTEYVENGASIGEVILIDADGYRVNFLQKGKSYTIRYQVAFSESARNVSFGTLIRRVDGVALGGASSAPVNIPSGLDVKAGQCYHVEFAFNAPLNTGAYFANAGVYGDIPGHDGFLARKLDALMFKILPNVNDCATGTVDLGFKSKVVVADSTFTE